MNEPVTKLTAIANTTKYPVDAFRFVQQALDFTVRRIHGNESSSDESRHVTGRDLCKGIRDYALQQYGLLALTVLSRWHIHSCEDFGHIVFAMVDAQMMRKTEEDSIRDFIDVYDFQQAFSPPLELTNS
jgi:uncharacterized repeat protein (TIGR04138 family)